MRLGSTALRVWLLVLALLCAAELLTHSGARNGFLISSQPQHSGFDTQAGDGYATYIGDVPVLLDSEGILKLTAFMAGQRGPEGTGILDRRAGYAYLATMTVPWAGPYAGYLLLNWAFWWAATAAMFWLVRTRWGDDALAMGASFLVATSQGFVFMAGVPMSYLPAYSMLVLLIALAERLGAFTQPRLRTWLLLGWGAGVASTLYFTQYVVLFGWWLYGLRRVPWRYLLAASAVTFGIAIAWELWGGAVGGLGFQTDNSSAVNLAFSGWITRARESWLSLLTHLRASAIRGTLIGAFPYPWWVLAAIGFWRSSRADREWALAIAMGGLIPAILLLSLLPLPRAAFYMYPAMVVLAARGALAIGAGIRWVAARAAGGAPVARYAAIALTALALVAPAAVTNLDLLGQQWMNKNYHYSTVFGW
jgi:hypothetical protein